MTADRRGAAVALALGLVLAAPGIARAQEIYGLRLEAEVPFVAGALAIAALPELYASTLEPAACLPDCDPRTVNPIDRWVVGRRSDTAEALSNVVVVALPLLGLGLELSDETGPAFWQDTFVALEAYAVHVLFVSLVKAGARRPRPYVYDPTRSVADRSGSSSTLSFFSGHTSSAFVTAIAFAETYRRRHDDWSVTAVYAGGIGLAAVVGVCRVLAGKHFLTDVLAGALVGTAFGILIPGLHARDPH